jgi:glycosyltransferase involved in cell wall biosynthesis
MKKNQHLSLDKHLYRYLLRVLLWIYHFCLSLLKIKTNKSKKAKSELIILVTGTFYSDHWLITHLRPMANAKNCASLIMVASSPVPQMNKVSAAYAPLYLQKIMGKVAARLCYFCWLTLKLKPDVLVGFHLLLNGLLVAILARLINAKSVYICGGGPREVLDGGVHTENRIFKRIGQADAVIEKQLLKAVNAMDLIISMGSSAIDYFQDKGITAPFQIVAGGFDENVFMATEKVAKKYDLILIGRLSQIKRVDRFIYAVQQAKRQLPQLNAVIVGDGPERQKLQALSASLGISEDIHFAGWQENVQDWLQQSRCFVLTSDSEGLSQALIQGMMSGLPAITSNVGDLSDLLVDGYNGFLISPLSADAFSQAFISLFNDPQQQQRFSLNAQQSSQHFSLDVVQQRWTTIFTSLCGTRL